MLADNANGRLVWGAVVLGFLGLLLLAALAAPVQADTEFPGNYTVTGTETWTTAGSPYIVNGHLTVAGTGRLTLDPGVEVRLGHGMDFTIQNGGVLTAEGSLAQTITITSTAPGNRWRSIDFQAGSTASLAHCDISRGGQGTNQAIYVRSSAVALDQSDIHHTAAGQRVLYLEGTGLSPTIQNTAIYSNTGQAVYQATVDMAPIYHNLTLADNGTDGVVINGGTLNRDLTLASDDGLNGRPYLLSNHLTVASGNTLTVTAGTTLKFAAALYLDLQNGAALIAEGSPTQPITFTSSAAAPAPADWIYIYPRAGSRLRLGYCDVSYAGNTYNSSLWITASDVEIHHCYIHHGQGDGLRLEGTGLSPRLEHLQIENNSGRAIYQSTIDMTPVYHNLTLAGNGTDGVVTHGGTLSRDLTLDGADGLNGSPYLLDYHLTVASGSTLTVTAGTTLKFAANLLLDLLSGSTLIAEGTPTRPITFTSRSATPAPGDWIYIIPRAGSRVRLGYCDVSYAGNTYNSSLWIAASDVEIHHCRIHDGLGDGLRLEGVGLSPRLEHLQIENNSGRAIYQSTIDMAPVYHNLTLAGNGTDGVVTYGGTLNRNLTLDGANGLNGSPYLLDYHLTVASGNTLTVTAGTTLKFAANLLLDLLSGSTLIAEGTPTQPITFTSRSATPAPGDWIYIIPRAGSRVRLGYCDVSYAGNTYNSSLWIAASDVEIHHCRIHEILGSAVRVQSNAQPTLSYNRFYSVTTGVRNDTPATNVDARRNWWGHASGPHHTTLNPTGLGVEVTDGVLFSPWLETYNWLAPDSPLLHGTAQLHWAALGIEPASLTADVSAQGPGGPHPLGTGLGSEGVLDWDTTAVLDGQYELRADFRDLGAQVAGTAARNVAVNNDPGIRWHIGQITKNETWAAGVLHVVEGDVRVTSGVTLTIEAGAVVKFIHGTQLVVEDGAVVDAPATAFDPIILTSIADDSAGGDTNLDGSLSLPAPGDWDGIRLLGLGQAQLTVYVEVRYVRTGHSGVLADSETWSNTLVHQITDDVTVPSGVTLTLEPGAVVKFGWKKGLVVQTGGHLVAQGTVARPIVLTSARDDSVGGDTNQDGSLTSPWPGDWRWMHLDGGQAVLDHLDIAYGGGNQSGSWDQTGALRTTGGTASLDLANSVIRDAFYDGILAWGGPVTVTNSVVVGADRGICAHPGSEVHVVNCTVDGNRIGLLVHGGTLNVANTLATNSLDSGFQYDGFGVIGTLRYNDTWSATGVNYRDFADDPTGTDGNLSVDPDYKDRAAGNYRLNYESPAIDAADGGLAPQTDTMGAPRYDDPRTPNTGLPTPGGVYADMGAYEFVETATSNVDLVVSGVHGPLSALAGQAAVVEWTVTSMGPGAPPSGPLGILSDPGLAVGPWHDTIFLQGVGGTLLAAEVLVGDGLVLSRGESHSFAAQVRVPGGVAGSYRWQVTVNTRGEVFEGQNTGNNTALSAASVALDLPALAVDGPALNRQFDQVGQSHWFKLSPGAGKDVLVSLDLDSASGATELYIAQGYMPTRQHFDARHTEWRAPDVTALAASTLAQTYCVLAYAESLPGATNFSIKAESLDYSIASVDQTQVGDAGTVTLGIRGGQLEENLTYEIVEPSGTPHGPTRVFFVDSSQVYATFDMAGLPHGLYDVQVRRGAVTRALPDAVEVVTAVPGTVAHGLTAPDALRPGWTGAIMVDYRNVGNVDAVAPLIMLTLVDPLQTPASAGSSLAQGLDPLATLAADQPSISYVCSRCPDCPCFTNPHPIYERAFPSLVMLGINREGPAGVLPPGASNTIALNLNPGPTTGLVSVRLYSGNPSAAAAWEALKDTLRPWFVPEDAWEAIYGNFKASVGSTVGELNAVLAENATYLSRLGEYEHDINRLLAFELEQSGLSEITQRYSLGAFGRGRSHPWDVWGELREGQPSLHYPNHKIRTFFPTPAQGSGGSMTFIGPPGDYGVLTRDANGTAWNLVERDGTRFQFSTHLMDPGRFYLDHIEDLNGNRVTLDYSADRVVSVLDSLGDSIVFAYNAQGRISQVTDPVGRVTAYTYDASGEHLTRASNSAGTIVFSYVAAEGAAREHALKSITYPDGTHDFLEYDTQGRLVVTYRDGGAEERTFAYDSIGGVTITDTEGNSIEADTNRFRQISEITDPLGSALQLAYDGAHRLTAAYGPGGITSYAGYDRHGNKTMAADPLGNWSHMAFTDYAGLSALTDARGNLTQYGYDARCNLSAITYASGAAERFGYDARGNLVKWTNLRGDEITYTYDAHDLLTRKDYDDGSHVEYAYDAHRNLLSSTDMAGTTSFSYDAADRLTRVAYPDGRFLEYTYDVGGRRSTMTDHGGFTVNYHYDVVGRLADLTDGSGTLIVTYAYDAVGRLAREVRGNGMYSTYEYDEAGQLLHLVNVGLGDAVISRFDYTYDDLGRRTSVTTMEGTTSYEYDAVGQLTGVSLPSGRTLRYTYDAAGNRVSVTDDGLLTSYMVNNLDQYSSIASLAFSYDADGNLVSRTDGVDIWTYTYDDENRLAAMATPASAWSFEYDVLGNRVATIRNGERTEYLIDPMGLGDVIAEYDDSDNLIARYTHGLGLASRVDPGGSPAYYQFDGAANAVQLTGPSGSVLNSYSFLPFGEALTRTETIRNPFTFVARHGVADDGEGIYFMRNRWYEPFSGRFTQPDPLGTTVGGNLYAYVSNRPTDLVDPSGLQLGSPIQMTPPTGVGGWQWAEWYLNTLGEPVVMRPSGGYPAKPMEYDMSRSYCQRGGLPQGENVLRSFYDSPRPGHPPEPKTTGLPRLYRFFTRKAILTIGRGAAVSGGTVATSVAGAMVVGGYAGYRLHVYLEQHPDATLCGLPLKDLVYNPDLVDTLSSGLASWYQFLHGQNVNVVGSRDPNDIVGPAGYGGGHYISGNAALPYTIHFENVVTATAPAQVVSINQQLDPNLDWSTFELLSFGFGDYSEYIREGLDAYAERLDVTTALGMHVDVDFNLDRHTGQVTWIFRSIDPVTGQVTQDPIAGFLPPNQTPPEGEGYVTYLIEPLDSLITGDEIEAQASIVFDTNDPITTSLWVNTMDADAPASSVDPLSATVASPFTVRWTGTDTGSGIASHDVYVSEDGGAYERWQAGTPASHDTYAGEIDHTYRFYSVATDHVGNREAAPALPDAETVCSELRVFLPVVVRNKH